MNKLTEDLNIIQNLPDQPTLSARELKAKFDEAAGKIKNYLNEVVEPTVTGIQGDYVASGDLIAFKNEINGSLEDIQTSIDEVIGNQLTEVNNKLAEKTTYGDFVVEQKSIAYSCSQSQGKTLTATYTKDGYKPLGIVGQYYSNLYEGWAQGAYASSINDSSITVTGYVARGNVGGTTTGNLIVNILWVKKN